MAALARGGRSVASWRDAIRELVRGSSYRNASLPLEELTRTLTRADASAEDRIGAALALTTGEPEQRERIRVAAQTCADPRIRIILEGVAEGAAVDDAIEEAIEAEHVAARTSRA